METLRKPWTRGFIFLGIRMIALLSLLCGCIVQADEDADENRRKLSLYFEGEDIYQQSCLPCHGPRGKGDGPWAEGWTKNRPRNFRSGIFKFRTTPMGFLPTDEDLKRTITNGISGTAMPMFRGNLNEGNLEAVIVYLKSFSREWKKKERRAEPVALSEKPDWMDDSTQRKEHAELGKALFATYCAACHGAEGKGNGAGAVGLIDQWQFAIEPADLSAEHYKSGDRAEDLFRTISTGLDGTPMVGFMGVLDDSKRWDLVAYIRHLQTIAK